MSDLKRELQEYNTLADKRASHLCGNQMQRRDVFFTWDYR